MASLQFKGRNFLFSEFETLNWATEFSDILSDFIFEIDRKYQKISYSLNLFHPIVPIWNLKRKF